MTKRSSSGFTLLEVMVAVAVIGGLLITLIYTVNTQLKATSIHETLSVATILARSKLDEVRAKPTEQLSKPEGAFEEPNAQYTYKIDVKPTEYDGVSELSVRVTREGESVELKKMVRSSTLK